VYWILLAAWTDAGAAAPEPTRLAPKIALRGVAETWDDTSIGTVYRTGALSGGAALILPLPSNFAVDVGFTYKRLSPLADIEDAKFEVLPITLSAEYWFGTEDQNWDVFVGLGPSLIVFSEHHPSNKKGQVVRGTRIAIEASVGVRIDTGLIEPRMAPAPRGLDGIEIEVFGARRTQLPSTGFALGAWRGGLGIVFRL
jgi:hypothetical protein